MRLIKHNVYSVLFCALFLFCGAAQVNKSPLRKRIAPPDPSRYSAIQDSADWRNPYFIVQANGIDVRPADGAPKTATMTPSQVLEYLEKLPASAWPYGLIVAVQDNGLGNLGDFVVIKKNREELVRLLENAGVKVDLWPSA